MKQIIFRGCSAKEVDMDKIFYKRTTKKEREYLKTIYKKNPIPSDKQIQLISLDLNWEFIKTKLWFEYTRRGSKFAIPYL